MASGKSNLSYLGVGCLIAGILLAMGLAVFLVFAYRWGQGVEEAMKDPDQRRQRVLEILGGDELPPGYEPMVGLSVPYFLQTAILTDQPAEPGQELPDLGERGLIYVSFRDFGRDREDLERFFAGETSDPAVLARHNIDVDLGERLANGRSEHSSGEIPWVSHRGDVSSVQTRGHHSGLITLFLVHCSDDAYNRVGIWFGPDAGPGSPAAAPAEADTSSADDRWSGTVADPATVDRFLGHFRFCSP